MTVYELIKSTLRLIRVAGQGQEPQPQDVEDALQVLRLLVDTFNSEELMMFDRTTAMYDTIANQASYTYGPDPIPPQTQIPEWSTGTQERPFKIVQATIRFSSSPTPQPIDYPLGIATSFDYNNISIKYTNSNLPRFIYFQPSYPIGKIFLWPVPSIVMPITLITLVPLINLQSLAYTIDLPPAYIDMLRYNLAVRLAPEYRVQLDQQVITEAHRLKSYVKSVNNQQLEQPVPLDPALSRQGLRTMWNIYRGDYP